MNQIDTLTPDLSFNHMNFNPMSFDLSNHSLKIQKSIRTPTPKLGVHLGVRGLIPSHFLGV
jgi:hypothetical protein